MSVASARGAKAVVVAVAAAVAVASVDAAFPAAASRETSSAPREGWFPPPLFGGRNRRARAVAVAVAAAVVIAVTMGGRWRWWWLGRWR